MNSAFGLYDWTAMQQYKEYVNSEGTNQLYAYTIWMCVVCKRYDDNYLKNHTHVLRTKG